MSDDTHDALGAADERTLALVDACRTIVRSTLQGVTASGMFDPLAVLAATGYTFVDLASEFLLRSAQQHGRVGFEEAKRAVLNLHGLMHEQTVARVTQLETEMEREDLTRIVPKDKVN